MPTTKPKAKNTKKNNNVSFTPDDPTPAAVPASVSTITASVATTSTLDDTPMDVAPLPPSVSILNPYTTPTTESQLLSKVFGTTTNTPHKTPRQQTQTQTTLKPPPPATPPDDYKRTNMIFYEFNATFPRDEAKPTDTLTPGRRALLLLLDGLKQLTDSAVLYPVRAPIGREKPELTLSSQHWSNEAFPKNMSQISKYFYGFSPKSRPNDSDLSIYTTVRIGFNGNEDDITKQLAAHTRENLNGWFAKSPLQTPSAKVDGFLLGSHGKMNLPALYEQMNHHITIMNLERPDKDKRLSDGLEFAFKWRTIWSGLSTKDQPPGYKSTYAVHVIIRFDQVETGRPLIKEALNRLNNSNYFNFPLRYVECIDKVNMDSTALDRTQFLITRQQIWLDSFDHILSSDFLHPTKMAGKHVPPVINPRTGRAQTFNVRRYLYAHRVHQDGKADVPLFVSCEPDMAHANHWITYPRLHKDEAMKRIKGLPTYMMRDYGQGADASFQIQLLFSTMGERHYMDQAWDEETQTVLTPEARYQMATDEAINQRWMLDMQMMQPPLAATNQHLETPPNAARPVPRRTLADQWDKYDDHSVNTTGTHMTEKGNLKTVTTGEFIDPMIQEATLIKQQEQALEKQQQQQSTGQAHLKDDQHSDYNDHDSTATGDSLMQDHTEDANHNVLNHGLITHHSHQLHPSASTQDGWDDSLVLEDQQGQQDMSVQIDDDGVPPRSSADAAGTATGSVT